MIDATGTRRRMARVTPDINVTPLVDVVLVLLIIFMVVAPHMDQDVQVTLPGIFNPDPEVEGQRAPLTVTVTAANEFYIEGERFDLNGVVAKLTELHAAEPNKRLALRADSALPYRDARAIFGGLREIGFPGMSLMVGHRTGRQPGVAASAAPADPATAPAAPAAGAAPAADESAPAPAAPEPAAAPPAGA
jgi:biopolymer transport protein ExbD/biopolymer transport protein TolR